MSLHATQLSWLSIKLYKNVNRLTCNTRNFFLDTKAIGL